MESNNREMIINEAFTQIANAYALLEKLAQTTIEKPSDALLYVHTEKDGVATKDYVSLSECNKLRKKNWDVFIDEPSNVVYIAGNLHELTYLSMMKRVMLWLAAENHSAFFTAEDIRAYSETVSEDIYQYPRHLKELLGPGLKERVLKTKRGIGYPVLADWTLCWIRKHQLAESSNLLIGTPKHRDIR